MKLDGNWVVEWNRYTTYLMLGTIRLSKYQDLLVWSKNSTIREYMVKLGYAMKVEKEFQEEEKWWQALIWKLPSPLKSRISMWLDLENKLTTGDNGEKRGWFGPNTCVLCKQIIESVNHLFVSCSFSQEVWRLVVLNLNWQTQWNKPLSVDYTLEWLINRSVLKSMSFPING